MYSKEPLFKKEEKLNTFLRALTENDPTSSFVEKLNNESSKWTHNDKVNLLTFSRFEGKPKGLLGFQK
jgi:hypothetical protein